MTTNAIPNREVAIRAFAAELNDATHTFKQSDEDRAPTYALLPTGVRANRVFFVGTLTDVENVSDDGEDAYWRARVSDTTGTFFVYAGQYQPEAAKRLEQLDTPAFVGIVGKPRTWEGDEGDVNVSIRPEEIMLLSKTERDEWIRETSEHTLDRVEAFDADANQDAAMAVEQYHVDPATYVEDVIAALETVADDTVSEDAAEDTSTTA